MTCAVISQQFCLDTTYLRKSDSLLFVIEQGRYLKKERRPNMDQLKNADPFILVALIRKVPFATLFYTCIKKCKASS